MLAKPRRLVPVQPRTMVEQAAEAIVAAAARGAFLPGDRLVEAEIARDLGISRVPVREALRLLESQGIVVSTPYKGMRLMQVTNRGVTQLMRVRLALELLAVRELLAEGVTPERLFPVQAAVARFRLAAATEDPAELVAAEEAFHGEICRASGNATLYGLWLSLSRQLAVVWGLSQGFGDRDRWIAEHEAIATQIAAGDAAAAEVALTRHVAANDAYDFEAMLEHRRHGRTR